MTFDVRHPSGREQRVLLLVLPEVELLDLAGPAQVFEVANHFGASYSLIYVGTTATPRSAQGLSLTVTSPLPEVNRGDLVFVPGVRNLSRTKRIDPQVVKWLQRADDAGARFASVCSGAFLLGHAGLLTGRRCTTHWSLTGALAHHFPGARVSDSALFVHDEPVTTSAGIASGIDMALSLVERDHGPLLTARVAREMVLYIRRNGAEPQHSIYLEYRTHLHQGVHRAQDWLISHVSEPVTLDGVGKIAGLSGRQLARQFKAATGLTPLQYQQRLRLELASTLMKDSRLTLDAIAERCGFEDARSLRRLWNEKFGQPPSQDRLRMTDQRSQ